MKTFQEFSEKANYHRQQIDEYLQFVPAALKYGGMALSALSAGSALNNLRQGKYKKAAFDAIGAVPGGRAFKVAKGLGATKNIARTASAAQSLARYGTDNVYSRGVDKAFNVASKAVTGTYNTGKKLFTKNNKNNNNNNNPSSNTKTNKNVKMATFQAVPLASAK